MGRWILISFISFPLTIIIIVGVLLVIKPPAKAPANPQAQGQTISSKTEKKLIKKVVAHDIRIGNMTHVKHTLDSLLTVIDVFEDSLKRQAVKVDSLNKKIASLQSKNDGLAKEIEKWRQKYNQASGQQMEAKSIARTLSSLKPKEMGKILAKMDDHAIILIYSQMSNTARSTLLAALDSDRAAAITQKMLKSKTR